MRLILIVLLSIVSGNAFTNIPEKKAPSAELLLYPIQENHIAIAKDKRCSKRASVASVAYYNAEHGKELSLELAEWDILLFSARDNGMPSISFRELSMLRGLVYMSYQLYKQRFEFVPITANDVGNLIYYQCSTEFTNETLI